MQTLLFYPEFYKILSPTLIGCKESHMVAHKRLNFCSGLLTACVIKSAI